MRIHALNMHAQVLNLNCRQIHTCTLFMLAAKALVSLVLYIRYIYILFLMSADFFLFVISKTYFKSTIMQSVKQFGSKYDPTLLGPDLCPNIMKMLSADSTSSQRVYMYLVAVLIRLIDLHF